EVRRVGGRVIRGGDIELKERQVAGGAKAVGGGDVEVDAQLGDGVVLVVPGRRVDVEAVRDADAEAEAEVPAELHIDRAVVHRQAEAGQADVEVNRHGRCQRRLVQVNVELHVVPVIADAYVVIDGGAARVRIGNEQVESARPEQVVKRGLDHVYRVVGTEKCAQLLQLLLQAVEELARIPEVCTDEREVLVQ